MRVTVRRLALCLVAVAAVAPWLGIGTASGLDDRLRAAWPRTDFGRHAVPLAEIMSGGPPKDGIPAIDDPRFVAVSEAGDLGPDEPVIGFAIGDDARAYPLRILTWHEIANDTVGGIPVAVTYCPLCNAAVVFDRSLDGRVLDFGVSGLLRHSDLIMYDRQTESWWQQFLGEAIVGELTGRRLTFLPARLESISRFRQRFPNGKVLVPSDPGLRAYGRNPYEGYDSAPWQFLYRGAYADPVPPLSRVVVVGDEAWPLELVQRRGSIHHGDLVITWESGQNSALDADRIADGRDVGNIVVQRRVGGELVDAVYDVSFAFAFHAFRPDGVLHRD